MVFSFLSLMKGEPLVSKLAVVAQFVVYPSVMLAYCAYVPESLSTGTTAATAQANAVGK